MGGKASKAIDLAKITHDLDLSYLELKVIPPNVLKMKALLNLNLSGNLLKPCTDFSSLINLETLDLAGNKLGTIPESIFRLALLQSLNLSFNSISQCSPNLSGCAYLRNLDLSGNKLESLPDAIGKLSSLVELNVEKNLLMALPDTLDQLKCLRKIYLSYNKWVHIPMVLAKLETVETFDLSYSCIREIESPVVLALAKCTGLRVLNLSYNSIRTITEDLTELFMLREIDLTKNPVDNWPHRVKEMMNIKFNWQEVMASQLKMRGDDGAFIKSLDAKVVIMGAQAVGKTSIARRCVDGKFPKQTKATVGASLLTKRMVLQRHVVRLQIWDTAGQERFRSMAPLFFRGSHAAIAVYDITSRSSFEDVASWIRDLQQYADDQCKVLYIVGNKKDLESNGRVVSEQEVERYAKSVGARFHEVSALADRGIENLLTDLCGWLIDDFRSRQPGFAGSSPAELPKTLEIDDGTLDLNEGWSASQARCCG